MGIAETKPDESFPNNQFILEVYHTPYKLDITEKNGGLMITHNTQIIAFEINLQKDKLIIASIYKAPSQDNKYFLLYLTNLLEHYSTRYEKIIILGDFNLGMGNIVMKDFPQEYMLYIRLKAINVLALFYVFCNWFD